MRKILLTFKKLKPFFFFMVPLSLGAGAVLGFLYVSTYVKMQMSASFSSGYHKAISDMAEEAQRKGAVTIKMVDQKTKATSSIPLIIDTSKDKKH